MPGVLDPKSTVIIDNGGSSIRCGFAGQENPSLIISNTTARIRKSMHELVGNETVTKINDYSQLFYKRPIQCGYVVDWETQTKIWKKMFDETGLNIDPHEYSLYMNDPPMNMYQLRKVGLETIFEYFQFPAFASSPTSLWSIHRGNMLHFFPEECQATGTYLVVDSGFSFTHILPYVDHKLVTSCIRRIDIGGKVLTNYLKQLVSLRYFDLSANTMICNEMKETMCFMSKDFNKDINSNIREHVKYYILPDYISLMKGYSTSDTKVVASLAAENVQFIPLSTERFAIPELLIHPSDMGLKQSGICETISNCISFFPEIIQEYMSKSILFTGGNTLFPGFSTRVQYLLYIYKYILYIPISDPWRGGSDLALTQTIRDQLIYNYTYEENGPDRLIDTIYENNLL
ncbi:hypothetical protein WA158_001888 [Blastocystis sp. Blastoise]